MEKKQSVSSEYYDEEEEKTTTSTTDVTVGKDSAKITKKKNVKKVLFDLSQASTAQAVMKEVMKQNSNKWAETINKNHADVNYVWCNAEDEVLIDVLKQKGKTINRYPGIKGLSHKDQFTRQMKVCLDLNPEAYNFVPPQF